jgi:predicted DNA-binding transcriptional regulator
MSDRALGYLILVGSLAGTALCFYLVFLSPWALLMVRLSAFLAMAAFLVIVAWIGYTLATTARARKSSRLRNTMKDDCERTVLTFNRTIGDGYSVWIREC